MSNKADDYCCIWCHGERGPVKYVNKQTRSTVCNSCRVDPVIVQIGSGGKFLNQHCKGKHRKE